MKDLIILNLTPDSKSENVACRAVDFKTKNGGATYF